MKRTQDADGWYRDERPRAGAGGIALMLVFGAGSGAAAVALFLLWFLTPTRRHPVDLEPPVPREMIGPLFFWGSISGAVIGCVAMAVYLWWFRRMEQIRQESESVRERARAEEALRFPR